MSLQRSLQQTHAFQVTIRTGLVKSGGAVPTAVGVCMTREQLLDGGGVTFMGGNINWRNAIVIALVHIASLLQRAAGKRCRYGPYGLQGKLAIGHCH